MFQSSAEPVVTPQQHHESKASCRSSENAIEHPTPLSSLGPKVEVHVPDQAASMEERRVWSLH